MLCLILYSLVTAAKTGILLNGAEGVIRTWYSKQDIVSYFKSYGIQFNNDALATSTMVQWLWRSRLRCEQEIWLYLPSSRMRKLLYKWVKDVTGNVECIEEWE